MNDVSDWLDRLIITRHIQRELYKELEDALFDRMFFHGKVDHRTIQNAKGLLDQLISEGFLPQFVKARYGHFFFGWGSTAGAATACAFGVVVYSDAYTLRVYNGEISSYYELHIEGVPNLNETQLENFKEMLGITRS